MMYAIAFAGPALEVAARLEIAAGQGQVRAAALSYRLTPWSRLFFLLIASVLPSRKPRVIDADSPSRSGETLGGAWLCGF